MRHRQAGKLLHGAGGAAAVEFALLAPLLGLILVAVIDYAGAINASMQVKSATQAGIQYIASKGFDASGATTTVQSSSRLTNIQVTPAPVKFCGCASETGITTVACSSTCSGGVIPAEYARVSAQATYSTILPYPGFPSSYTFTAESVVRLQ